MNLRALLIAALLLLMSPPGPSAARPGVAPAAPDKGPGCGVTTQSTTTVSVTVAGPLSGRVSTAAKTPLIGGEVWICRIPTDGGVGKLETTTTGQDGSYVFNGLNAGNYQLTFVDPTGAYAYQFWNSSGQNAPSSSYASTLVLYDDKALTDINRVLPVAGRIAGQVSNRRGERLPNLKVSVEIRDLSGLFETTPISPTLSGPDGTYALGGLPTSDRYRLVVSDPEKRYHPATLAVSVTAGGITRGVDVTLAQTGGNVEGRVTDVQGEPLAGILVTPYQSIGAGVWQPLPAEATKTDLAGAYQLFNLLPGAYRIGFSDPSGQAVPEFYSDAPDLGGASELMVQAEGTLGGIDAALAFYRYVYLPLVRR